MDLDLPKQFQLRGAAQSLVQDFFLDLKLVLVIRVLVVASTAAGKIWTGGLHAVAGRLENRVSLRAREPWLLLGEGGFDLLSAEDEGYEYRFAASSVVRRQSGKAIAAIDQLFNGEEQEAILNQKSQRSSRRCPRSPGPLEIKSAKMAGHVDDLANEEQARNSAAFHRFG